MTDTVIESLKCAICLDYATDAVETKCCEQGFCESCLTGITSGKCPSCSAENLAFTASKTLRRLIAYLPADCPNGCEQKTTRGELKRHLEICPKIEYVCPIDTCGEKEKFRGKENDYANHLMTAHRRYMFAEASKSVEKEECRFPQCKALVAKSLISEHVWTEHGEVIASLGKIQCPVVRCNSTTMSAELMLTHLAETHQKQLCDKMKNVWLQNYTEPCIAKNQKGNLVSMAHNGKFYCGQPNAVWTNNANTKRLQRSKKCDVVSEQGVNCDACMQLDVIFRNLAFGSLVNGKGRLCKPQPCAHELKASGTYFDRPDKRSILCHPNACGNSPKYYCGELYFHSTYSAPVQFSQHCIEAAGSCKDCVKIATLMAFSCPDDSTKSVYEYVW